MRTLVCWKIDRWIYARERIAAKCRRTRCKPGYAGLCARSRVSQKIKVTTISNERV